jgi:hypothetical protein
MNRCEARHPTEPIRPIPWHPAMRENIRCVLPMGHEEPHLASQLNSTKEFTWEDECDIPLIRPASE